MLKHPYHVEGPTGLLVSVHLNFGAYILEKMWSFRDNVALRDLNTDNSTTYKEMAEQAMNLAVSLTRMGVQKQDVVALMSENRSEFFGAVIGAACTGAIVTTICPTYMKDELKNALNISKPKLIIISPTAYQTHEATIKNSKSIRKIILFGSKIHDNTVLYQDLAVNVEKPVDFMDFKAVNVNGQSDTLFIIYSSGTTGLPKGVMLTHLNVITTCCLPPALDPRSLNLAISPWYHSMGLIGGLSGLAVGREVTLMTRFDVDLYLKIIEKYKISQLTVVPPVLVAVCKYPAKYDLSCVKIVYSGAAPLHKDTLEAVFQKFPNLEAVMQGYGASETTFGVIKFQYSERRLAAEKPGSVGLVVGGTTVKIVDTETRKALGPNQRGEICVQGPLVMKGYMGIGRGTDFDDEGFYKTGDIGYYDEERFFYVVDRLKELIKYKGFQVPPAELEALLLTHPSVKDVGVIGIPHESGGEVPLAFVATQPGATVRQSELQQYVAERLSNPKHLRGGVRFLEQIPKSPSGKILRKELRKLYRDRKSKL